MLRWLLRLMLLAVCVGVMVYGVHLFSSSEDDAGKGIAVLVIAIGGVAFIAFKAATALSPFSGGDDWGDGDGGGE